MMLITRDCPCAARCRHDGVISFMIESRETADSADSDKYPVCRSRTVGGRTCATQTHGMGMDTWKQADCGVCSIFMTGTASDGRTKRGRGVSGNVGC